LTATNMSALLFERAIKVEALEILTRLADVNDPHRPVSLWNTANILVDLSFGRDF
jgi:hypothetical protein